MQRAAGTWCEPRLFYKEFAVRKKKTQAEETKQNGETKSTKRKAPRVLCSRKVVNVSAAVFFKTRGEFTGTPFSYNSESARAKPWCVPQRRCEDDARLVAESWTRLPRSKGHPAWR